MFMSKQKYTLNLRAPSHTNDKPYIFIVHIYICVSVCVYTILYKQICTHRYAQANTYEFHLQLQFQWQLAAVSLSMAPLSVFVFLCELIILYALMYAMRCVSVCVCVCVCLCTYLCCYVHILYWSCTNMLVKSVGRTDS